MNKAELIELVQSKLGTGTSKKDAAEALEAVLQAVDGEAPKRPASRKRAAPRPLTIGEALKRDVVTTTVPLAMRKSQTQAGPIGKKKTLREFKDQINWR